MSHLVVDDDLQAAEATLRWLSYLPIRVGDPTRCLPCPDPIDRDIRYAPPEGAAAPTAKRSYNTTVSSALLVLGCFISGHRLLDTA